MVIVDTNIWLEQLLGQARAAEVGEFLAGMPPGSLLMTDFTLHSIGVILTRLRRPEVLIQFVDDVFGGDAVELVSVEPDSMARVVEIINQFRLDFDDAYQYVAAEQDNAGIVSFDADFDRTDRGQLTPAQALAQTRAAE